MSHHEKRREELGFKFVSKFVISLDYKENHVIGIINVALN